MSLEGRRVLVTGASGGIGSRTALLFAERGADVAVHYNSRRERAEDLAVRIAGLGRRSFTLRADLGSPAEAEAMVEEAAGRLGGLDVLVNNAALHPPPLFSLSEPDWSHWRKMMDVNVMAVIACSRAAAPHLKESLGCIVNVVMDWDAGGVGYTLTKAAGTPLTRGLARELAPVRVNAVSPGAVDTWGMTEEEKAYWAERTLLRRPGEPGDIAGPIVFLASDEARYITGATLQVDGGARLLV